MGDAFSVTFILSCLMSSVREFQSLGADQFNFLVIIASCLIFPINICDFFFMN